MIKLFKKTKEIISKEGKLHFLRYRLFSIFDYGVYLHVFSKPDKDEHLHDHPWDFITIILKGGYVEKNKKGREYKLPFNITKYKASDYHKISCLLGEKSVSLVLRGPRKRNWGYFVDGNWVDHKTYRINKNFKKDGK